jgi:hypothetical protein
MMATLNDLPIQSLYSLSREEGLQLILTMRERRRFVLEKPVREKVVKERSAKLPTAVTIANMSEQQITDLYYKLMAKQQKELL